MKKRDMIRELNNLNRDIERYESFLKDLYSHRKRLILSFIERMDPESDIVLGRSFEKKLSGTTYTGVAYFNPYIDKWISTIIEDYESGNSERVWTSPLEFEDSDLAIDAVNAELDRAYTRDAIERIIKKL